jgi:hypothetical protein
MILIVDMNWKAESLAFNEFVKAIATVVSPLEECIIKHYLELDPTELKQFSKIILSGNHPKRPPNIKTPRQV